MDADRAAEKAAKEDARRKVVAALLKAGAKKGNDGIDLKGFFSADPPPPVQPIWGTRG